MKILIAVDDSAYSQAAMDWAKSMTWPARTEFLVLSAARPIVASYAVAEAPAMGFPAEIYEEEVKHHQEISARFERQLRDHGFKSRALVAQGDPREAIVDAVREHGVDLVVLGSHGRTGFTKLLLGSVASHVVTHAPCSVLVVKLANGAKNPKVPS
ncbi:MAG TPA: universal stress protein [Candidatus Sulfotelmatobacter sp.]|nr:universal stress protein [Candidatus Sulfotelmatobacter sp.]